MRPPAELLRARLRGVSAGNIGPSTEIMWTDRLARFFASRLILATTRPEEMGMFHAVTGTSSRSSLCRSPGKRRSYGTVPGSPRSDAQPHPRTSFAAFCPRHHGT